MLSVIIPITGENRKRHAEVCVHFLRKQKWKNFEIILIEQVNSLLGGNRTGGPFYDKLNGIDTYLAIKDPRENHFNQPWMANVGANLAKGDKFLFYDIDLVCTDTYLEAVYRFGAPYFIAWNKMFSLTKAASQEVHKTKKLTGKLLTGAEIYKSGVLDYAGFSVCITKDCFFGVLGGYNENYLGWGGNDNDIAWRALKIMGHVPLFNHKLYHLWHPKGYAKFLLWERRDVWLTTHKYPKKVNNRLLKTEKGNPNKQTYINISDICVDSKEEHRRKRARR